MNQTYLAVSTLAMNSREDTFVAEASELGWPPGEVPTSFVSDLEDREEFFLVRRTSDEFLYRSSGGKEVTIFND